MAHAVMMGAFGSHLLRETLEEKYMSAYDTATRYEVYHALTLLALGILAQTINIPKYLYFLFLAGIVLFSGSLYGLALGSMHAPNPLGWLGPLTPLGGVCFILAWFMLAWNIYKR
jgi:uncharacterized membrane protein YgdD (TMEM256/DUF423 family)